MGLQLIDPWWCLRSVSLSRIVLVDILRVFLLYIDLGCAQCRCPSFVVSSLFFHAVAAWASSRYDTAERKIKMGVRPPCFFFLHSALILAACMLIPETSYQRKHLTDQPGPTLAAHFRQA